jgi:hypothetical protein
MSKRDVPDFLYPLPAMIPVETDLANSAISPFGQVLPAVCDESAKRTHFALTS